MCVSCKTPLAKGDHLDTIVAHPNAHVVTEVLNIDMLENLDFICRGCEHRIGWKSMAYHNKYVLEHNFVATSYVRGFTYLEIRVFFRDKFDRFDCLQVIRAPDENENGNGNEDAHANANENRNGINGDENDKEEDDTASESDDDWDFDQNAIAQQLGQFNIASDGEAN